MGTASISPSGSVRLLATRRLERPVAGLRFSRLRKEMTTRSGGHEGVVIEHQAGRPQRTVRPCLLSSGTRRRLGVVLLAPRMPVLVVAPYGLTSPIPPTSRQKGASLALRPTGTREEWAILVETKPGAREATHARLTATRRSESPAPPWETRRPRTNDVLLTC